MFVDPARDPRGEPPPVGDERALLTAFLRWQRQTLEVKCGDLSAEELARRAVPPSTMSLLGLVRHMADVEHGWFRTTMAGLDAPRRWRTDATPDSDFDDVREDPKLALGQ